MIDPALQIWGADVAVYLFLGGLVAGMMVILGYFLFKGRHKELRCSCALLPGLGIILLSAGMFALFLDLEHRWQFWRMYVTFKPASPMSWGSWILLLVYPSLLAALLLRLPEPAKKALPFLRKAAEGALEKPGLVRAIGIANMALGGMLGIYTGILLSTLGARPLWNSALLGPLFLASGLSSAAALVHMVARERGESEFLARADNRFLQAELVILALFLVGLVSSTRVHKAAAGLFLGGPYTALFWVGVVGAGIAVPLFIQTLAVGHRVRHTSVAPVLVMAGGLLLRFVFVSAGQFSHWRPF